MFQRRPQTRSPYRSVRYRLTRDEQTRTAEQSACNFRIKRNSLMEITKTTMAQTIQVGASPKHVDVSPKHSTIDLQRTQLKQIIKIDYLKSFNSMMQRTDRIKFRQKAQRSVSFLDDVRVVLPNFQQNEKQVKQSEHSLLTPLVTPFRHLKIMISNTQNELNYQKNQCRQLKYDLSHLKSQHIENLNDLQKKAKEQFQNIRAILRKNQINQQQKKLKTKRELALLTDQHESNKKLFQQIHNRSSNMQIDIFNSTPFNLRERNDEKGQFYI